MLTVAARWRIIPVLGLLLFVPGCRRANIATTPAASSVVVPASATVSFHVSLENRSAHKEVISLAANGAEVARHELAPRQTATFSIQAQTGWNMIQTKSSTGAAHQAMVQGDKQKWILIRRDTAKREGFGFHVTEYRRK